MHIENIFKVSGLPNHDLEWFETLLQQENVHIERIISNGQTTPEGKWYDQQHDEFVVLLQGRASIEFDSGQFIHLTTGDYIHIPARKKHRVSFTSTDPHCIWLAIHIKSTN